MAAQKWSVLLWPFWKDDCTLKASYVVLGGMFPLCREPRKSIGKSPMKYWTSSCVTGCLALAVLAAVAGCNPKLYVRQLSLSIGRVSVHPLQTVDKRKSAAQREQPRSRLRLENAFFHAKDLLSVRGLSPEPDGQRLSSSQAPVRSPVEEMVLSLWDGCEAGLPGPQQILCHTCKGPNSNHLVCPGFAFGLFLSLSCPQL